VAVIERAPWSYKPEYKIATTTKTSEEHIVEPPSVFFIEPSTGCRFEACNEDYLGIESIWNQHNYYVNCQNVKLANMRWDLGESSDWEHLLPGEPYEMRVNRTLPEDHEVLTENEELSKEKHLDMPMSWVNQLQIILPVFEERYPDGYKMVHYKKSILEVFAPYKNPNGLMKQLTLFATVAYEQPLLRYNWFENRDDLLVRIVVDYEKQEQQQVYAKRRPDALQKYTSFIESDMNITFEFYHQQRSDALKQLVITEHCMQESYAKRDDL
jgi:hypothetical protein